MLKKSKALIVLASVVLINGCAMMAESDVSEGKNIAVAADTLEVVAKINDFPTRDRVEYVFNCIAKHGEKLGYIVQYACGCKIDKIAEKMNFSEYESALTFSYLKSTPGENGSVFRDPKQSKDLRTRLKEAEAYAESQCFVS